MKFNGHAWAAQVDAISDLGFLEYKYCVVDQEGKLLRYENGSNRLLSGPLAENNFIILDGYVRLDDQFKGTGIAIPC
jgi:hypothetical protein